MNDRFPKDCWEKKCQHFHTVDMSVDDLLCACDLLGAECDACDEDYSFGAVPAENGYAGGGNMNGCSNCSKRREIKLECPWGGTYHHKGENGEEIGICNAYRQETNADRIQAMSDEKMAKDLIPLIMEVCEDGIPCDEYMLDWAPSASGGGTSWMN